MLVKYHSLEPLPLSQCWGIRISQKMLNGRAERHLASEWNDLWHALVNQPWTGVAQNGARVEAHGPARARRGRVVEVDAHLHCASLMLL